MLLNTTHKVSGARGPLSQWTEAWPTQPAMTQAKMRLLYSTVPVVRK